MDAETIADVVLTDLDGKPFELARYRRRRHVPAKHLIRKQRWSIRHPDRFQPEIDWD